MKTEKIKITTSIIADKNKGLEFLQRSKTYYKLELCTS